MQPPDFSSTACCIGWHARHAPSATAVIEDALRVTYQDMAADLVHCAQALEACGMAPGILVGVETRRPRYLHLLLLLACEALGVATTSFALQELGGGNPVLRHCNILLLEAPVAGNGQAALAIPSNWLDRLVAMRLDSNHVDFLQRQRQGVADGIARIIKTSGTTGQPKAVVTSRATQQRIITRMTDRLPLAIRENAKFLYLYDFTVRGMYMRALSVLQQGGTVLLATEHQAHGLLGAGAANYAAFIVGDIERIVQGAVPPPVGHDLYVELVGDAVSADLRRLIRQRLSARVCTHYSSNETQAVTETDDENVGTILPNVAVRIVDETGHDKPPGETGLIRVRTDTMADGYFGDPALTAAAFVDGWYLTNDVGYMPAPGKLVVLGRADDMLNIGGVKLPPRPIEEAVRRIPGIRDAAAMSIEGPYQVGRLLVALESEQPVANLAAAVSKILARHPNTFEIMLLPCFPRTQTGKVRRQEIKAMFQRNREGTASLIATDR